MQLANVHIVDARDARRTDKPQLANVRLVDAKDTHCADKSQLAYARLVDAKDTHCAGKPQLADVRLVDARDTRRAVSRSWQMRVQWTRLACTVDKLPLARVRLRRAMAMQSTRVYRAQIIRLNSLTLILTK